jgi:LysM repeat protein
MNRTTTRKVSRALVVGLAGVIALGGVFWLGKLSGSASTATAKVERGQASEATIATRAAAAANPTTKPAEPVAVLQTPSTPVASPSTQPSNVVAAPPVLAAATTRPSNGNVQLASIKAPAAAEELIVGNPIADAKSKIEHGKVLDARKILNTALTSKTLSPADAKSVKGMLNDLNTVIVFSSKQFAQDEYGGVMEVPSGGAIAKIAKSHDISAELLMRINAITDARKLQAGKQLKVITGPFNAVVDKSDFALELWLGEPDAKGSMYVCSMPVGLGENDSTPTGTWAIKNRLKNPAYYSPRGEGIIAPDDPKNPLGEYWLGLTGTEGQAVDQKSYGIHGTIEPDSIGKQASMGCIRLRDEDIKKVYEALVDGKSTVTVRE